MAIIPVRITLRNHRYKSTLRKRNSDNLTSVKVSKSKSFQPNLPENRVFYLACTFKSQGIKVIHINILSLRNSVHLTQVIELAQQKDFKQKVINFFD